MLTDRLDWSSFGKIKTKAAAALADIAARRPD
jgi:hypothetical protein